jgi:hypothetical protein
MAVRESEVDDQGARLKIIIGVGVVAAIFIGGLFYLLMRASGRGPAAPTRLEGAIHPGSAEWNDNIKFIVRDEPWADESKRALGDTVMTLHTKVRNFSRKTINGLELWAAVVDHQGKPVKQRTAVVVPSPRKAEIGPDETAEFQVMLDGMSDTDDRANIKLEIAGFRFKP